MTQFTNHKIYYGWTSYQNVIPITCREKNLPIARTLNLNFNQAFEILKDALYITLQEGNVYITLHVWHNPNKYYIFFKRLTFKKRVGIHAAKICSVLPPSSLSRPLGIWNFWQILVKFPGTFGSWDSKMLYRLALQTASNPPTTSNYSKIFLCIISY